VKREELNLKIGASSGANKNQTELWAENGVSACDLGISLLKQGIKEGENPVFDPEIAAYGTCFESRIAWECCPKWVVNFIQS